MDIPSEEAEAQDSGPPPAEDLFAGSLPLEEALQKLRLRLLDLTARNRLLNFKHSVAKTLQFVEGHLGIVYSRLTDSADRRVTLLPVPEPRRSEFVEKQGRLSRPEVRDHARAVKISTFFEIPVPDRNEREQSALRGLLYPDELERHSRKLARAAKTAIEETGANMLFLLLGFLEYPEAPGAAKALLAPLVPVPVALEKGELERATGTYRYSLLYTGEELAENLSLREKLKQDFNLELPVFTEEESLEKYFQELERAIQGKPGFKLRRQATLALVSMTKMLLVRDLDPKNWPTVGRRSSALTQHNIIRMVFEGKEFDGEDRGGEEYEVDKHKHADLPLIFDADSSQHSALIDVVDGKNLVIEGPPGTGKSQTITNLVAAAISKGQKVLFVAEKLAALQVVKSRLTQAGLADFCLELHSNKTSKKDVLESIATRASRHYGRPTQLAATMEALRERRHALNTYVELINSQSGNAQGMTVHQVLWRAERYRQQTSESWKAAQKVTVSRAADLTQAEFDSFFDELSRLAQEHERIETFGPAAPFWGFFPQSLPPAAEVEIEHALDQALPALTALRNCYIGAAEVLDAAKVSLNKQEARGLSAEISSLADFVIEGMAEDMLPRLFASRHGHGRESESVLRKLESQKARAAELLTAFKDRLKPDLRVDADIQRQAEAVSSSLRKLGIEGQTAEELRMLSERLRVLIAEAQHGLDDLRALAGTASQKFEGSDACVAQIAVPVELAIQCPKEHLHHRTPELNAPGAAAVILGAKRRFLSIAETQTLLSEHLYLDNQIGEREVEDAVSVLREGLEWWRVFQSRHRAAVAFHNRLSKHKKVRKQQRFAELEKLHAHLRESRLAKEDARYRHAMGVRWLAEATEFDALHAMASWLEKSRNALLEAQLDSTAFSPLECSAVQVVALSKSGERVTQARQALESCSALFLDTGVLKDAPATKKIFFAYKTWAERLDLLSRLAGRLDEHTDTLARWAPSDVPANIVAQALRDNEAYFAIVESVASDERAKSLLGYRHEHLQTELAPAFQALAYGRAVLDLKLPAEVDRVLLSEKGNVVRTNLLQKLSEIERAWLPVEQFSDFMCSRGRFELAAWAGRDTSHHEFVDEFLARTNKAKSGISGLLHWTQYLQASAFCRERGLGEFVDLLETDQVPREQLASLFGYRFYGTIAEDLFNQHKPLGRFSALSHEALRNEFRNLDRETIRLRGKDVAAQADNLCAPPEGAAGGRVADKRERGLLEYLFPQTKPRMPIRQMMTQAGRAIQAYKPCFMMGPQAVAQYLPPGEVEFDIVVMDEASQLKPEEALGAIARGKQLVVVGDPKQLPPTTFFDKLGETQDDDDQKGEAALMQESILDVCMGHFRPVRTLRWHYRSQHESLIAFSNARFYRSNLIVFPSPYGRSRSLGVKCRYIKGATYDSGMNIEEAKVVVDAALAHMKDRPNESLGVVTLNLKQRELIEELLDRKMREVSFAENFNSKHEAEGYGFFVKNLENVQGDERDVILISTTFGPAPGTGTVFQRFGPISRHDGWRRLNVLFTRARKSLTVFTSMHPEQINDGDGVPRGTRELRAYLDYVRTGNVPDVTGSQGEPDSDFEVSVMEALQKHGFECTSQLGVAGFRLDLAVKHPAYPGSYLAAIECDGAAYHSGRSARDRDRIRQEILERLGWQGKFYRIWSTDWYRAPAQETGRLVAWLQKLKAVPLPDAYLAEPEREEIVVRATTPIVAAAGVRDTQAQASSLESLGVKIGESDQPLEIQIGDKVTYAHLGDERQVTVTIGTRTDASCSLIDYRTPLADALLGLNEGELAALRQPDRPVVRLKVLKIERPGDARAA